MVVRCIEGFLIIFLEILSCKVFYGIFGEKRRESSSFGELVQVILLSILTLADSYVFSDHLIIKTSVFILGIAVVMYLIMEINFVKSLILSVVFDGILFVMDYIVFIFSRMLFQNIVGIEDMGAVQGVLMVLLGNGLLLVLLMILERNIGRRFKGSMGSQEWLVFALFPVLTIAVIIAMVSLMEKSQTQGREFVYFMIAFVLVGINLVQFHLINSILKREEKIREDQSFLLKTKNQTQMYYSISENLEKHRRMVHEYKNQILCISSLLQKKEYQELEEYLGNINQKFEVELDAIQTNHVIVDAILNTKYREMTEKNIIFVFRINDLSHLPLSDEDIVVVLSNLLNNAVEACEKCQGKKVIKLKFVMTESSVILSVKNSYESPLVIQNGEYQTTKNEEEEHGIGIRNIAAVIERYGGSYVIKHDEREFYFSILIPL